MKVFLDIGSHIGETLLEVTKEKYAFDKIVCFEPSKFCLDKLNRFSEEDERIVICEFGLSNRNQEAELFQPGSLGGTIFKGKDLRTGEIYYYKRKGLYKKNGRVLVLQGSED